MPLPELAFENQWSGHKQAGGETQVHSGSAKGTEEGTHGAQQIVLTGTGWGRLLIWEQCALIHHSGRVTGTLQYLNT